VRLTAKRFTGDLHTIGIEATAEEISAVTLTGRSGPGVRVGVHAVGADRSLELRGFPPVPQAPFTVRYTVDVSSTTDRVGYHDHNWGNVA